MNIDNLIEDIMLNSIENNISLATACKRTGISYKLIQNAMKQREIEHKTANQKNILAIKKIADELTQDMKGLKLYFTNKKP